jgi:non-specific serine/threonine protein kinase
MVAQRLGDHRRSLALYEDFVALARDMGDKGNIAIGLYNLGGAILRAGDLAKAAALFAEAVGLADEIGERRLKVFALWGLAETERQAHGDRARVAALAAESVRLLQQLASREAAHFELLQEVADWAVEAADHARAARLLGATTALWRGLGADVARAPDQQAAYDRYAAAARQALGDAFEAEWAAGHALSYDDVFAEALAALAVWAAMPDALASGDAPPAPDLTSREREVLALVAEGRTDREIAALHRTSPRTVSVHVGQILAKLGAPTRAAAAATAVRRGLI